MKDNTDASILKKTNQKSIKRHIMALRLGPLHSYSYQTLKQRRGESILKFEREKNKK